MSIDKPGEPLRVGKTSPKARTSIIQTGQRRVEAVSTPGVADRFIGTPPRQGFDLRHLGIGRNVDVYA